MHRLLLRIIRMTILLVIVMRGETSYATHIVGGEVTYKFLGTVAGGNKYEFSLSIYEDCLNGSPGAIAEDNPAYVAVYDGNNAPIYFDSIHYSSAISVPLNFNLACISNPPNTCLLKKTFIINYVLHPNSTGYIFTYQRCCRNAALDNIESPGISGSTYFCYIPPDTVVAHNTSAVFNSLPPQIICSNEPITYDNSATDADGDSLSYELCEAYDAPNGIDRDKPPLAPPYDVVNYVHPPYSYYNPLTGSPPVAIDPATGSLTCTPSWAGRYLVTVCCHEWRHGIMINTIRREFQFVVTPCSRTVVANMPYFTDNPFIYEIDCKDHTIFFENTSTGATTWYWNFGQPGALADTSNAFQPTYEYPDSGVYSVKLIANPGTPCADSISKLVKVYPTFSTAFTDSGKFCPGIPIQFEDRSTSSFPEITRWSWTFGDGTGSTSQNPAHVFPVSGTFNVTLISGNTKGCTDTSLQQVEIEHFKPYAGDDTIIVKGEQVQFHATGGIQYTWSPNEYLEYNSTDDPIGYFADTGKYTYVVSVLSAYGCYGTDTVNVLVVDHPAFYLPTGFSPNGDGLNDIFRPLAIGYKTLKFFRIYDRWGEEVYYSTTLNDGWDGTYNRHRAALGTYYWQIGYIDRYGKDGNMKGCVTLVR